MALNRLQASRLLNTGEMQVFHASLAEQLKSLTAAQLAALIRRARTFRDKSKDLMQRQRVATRGRTGSKGGTDGAANQRSGAKLQAISEALQRFEKRLEQLEAAKVRALQKTIAAQARLEALQKRAASKKVSAVPPSRQRSAKAPAKAPTAKPKGPGPGSERAREARHDMNFKESHQTKIQAHVSAAGRRSQAKRDSRG